MLEMSTTYLNRLAEQIVLISSLLGGFSIAIVANLVVSEINTRLHRNILLISTLAAAMFLMAIFAMTNLLLITTEGYPFKVGSEQLKLSRVTGSIFFFLGIIGILTVLALSGWTKSKRLGRITTIIGIVTLVMVLVMTSA